MHENHEKYATIIGPVFYHFLVIEVKEAFAIHDKNATGSIATKHLIYVMRSLGQNPTEEETNDMICEVDIHGKLTSSFFLFVLAQN